jgi:hypothetical protein
MHVNSFHILEFYRIGDPSVLTSPKKHIVVDLIYCVYSERFVRQSFLHGELHHVYSYRIIGCPSILTSLKGNVHH